MKIRIFGDILPRKEGRKRFFEKRDKAFCCRRRHSRSRAGVHSGMVDGRSIDESCKPDDSFKDRSVIIPVHGVARNVVSIVSVDE